MIAPVSPLEAEIFELWKEIRPDDAYIAGIDEAAGKSFVPTEANLRRALARIKALKRRATKGEDVTAKKFLAGLEARLELAEPGQWPEAVLESFFFVMLKSGIRDDLMTSIASAGRRTLDEVRKRSVRRRTPTGQRILALLAGHGLLDVIATVEAEVKEAATKEELTKLREAVDRYLRAFEVRGFRPGATFEETYELLKEKGANLGRSRIYAKALRGLWDYAETPAQVEAAGLRMLRRELPKFREIVTSFAKDLGCEAQAEAVENGLKEVRGLRKDVILPYIRGLREVAEKVAHKHLIDINPKYSTLVLETPPYLANLIPSGAAYSLDSLTERSREVFLATTDERSQPKPGPAEILNLLVHEEYGHCVHGSNATHAYRAQPRLLDVLNSPAGCTSEGLAFQIELDFVPILRGIAEGSLAGPEESAFAAFLEPWGGIPTVAREYEFYTYLWRQVRFLRVIGDARINSGKQDLVDFIDWAHRATGLQKATVYYQLFPAHQVLGPGYATTYAIIGERVRAIQERARRRGKALRDFNGYAASIGWPAKSLFEAKLEAWARAR